MTNQELTALAQGIVESEAMAHRLAKWLDVLARRARAAGASWASIGGLLDITRQAAQQRFGSDQALIRRLDSGPVHLAELQRRANRMGHTYLGTEHVMLELLSQHFEPLDAAMAGCGVDAATVRRAIRELVGTPGPGVSRAGELSGGLRRCLVSASTTGALAGRYELSRSDILLGIINDGNGIAAEVMSALSIDSPSFRQGLAERAVRRSVVLLDQFPVPDSADTPSC